MSEIRASSAEKAAHLLDSAISARSVNAQGRDSHFVFTLHLFQHRWAPFLFFCGSVCLSQPNYNELYRNVFSLNPSTPATPSLLGGRSRLHLIDFGCCERTKTLGGSITQVNLAIHITDELTSAQAGLGNVILGVLNGQRHLPFKESRVTQLLREVLGSVSCQVGVKKSQNLLLALKTLAGGPPGPHLSRAKPVLGDPAHNPACLADPPDAPQEDAGGRGKHCSSQYLIFLFLGGRGERGWQWQWQQ